VADEVLEASSDIRDDQESHEGQHGVARRSRRVVSPFAAVHGRRFLLLCEDKRETLTGSQLANEREERKMFFGDA